MRNIKIILIMLICLLCVGCQPITKPETPSIIIPNDPNDVVSNDVVYDEQADSLEGLSEEQILDLSGLKAAFDAVDKNYISKTTVFFDKRAVSRVNIIFNQNFRCQQTTLYNNNYIYRYTDDGAVNKGRVNLNNNLYSVELKGNSLESRFNSTINVEALKLLYENSSIDKNYLTLSNFSDVYKTEDITNYYFPLSQFDSNYVDTYGPTQKVTTIYGEITKNFEGWKRISKNKYMCDRMDVVEHFITICAPDYPIKDGAYMTYSHVTVEVNPYADTALRLRVYATSTQSGKLIASHIKKDKPNWYLLFAEASISNVNTAKIEAFEKLYK